MGLWLLDQIKIKFTRKNTYFEGNIFFLDEYLGKWAKYSITQYSTGIMNKFGENRAWVLPNRYEVMLKESELVKNEISRLTQII